MTLRETLLTQTKAAVVEHTVDGQTFKFRRPQVEAQHRVHVAMGLAQAITPDARGARRTEKVINLGRGYAQALVETLLDETGERLAFTLADVPQVLAAPIGSTLAKLAEFASTLFNRTTSTVTGRALFDAYNAAGSNPGVTFDGRPVPTWDLLNDDVRAKWDAAADRANNLPDEAEGPNR
jgi:hypothetical protein